MSGNPTADIKSVLEALSSDQPDHAVISAGLQDVLVRDDVLMHYFENGTADMGVDTLNGILNSDSFWKPEGDMIEEADIRRVVGVMGTLMGLMLIEDNIEGARSLSVRILESEPNYSFALLVGSALHHCGNNAGQVFRNSLAMLSKDTKEPV